jgi:ATP/maltotriose-dependent transcriptional regulator MalT
MQSLPKLRAHTLSRSRLLHSLHIWQDLRLVRIVAPAGFGKTTFAAHWARSLSELPELQRPHIAWISLFADPAPARFLHSLVESLVAILPDLRSLLTLDGSGEFSTAQRMRMLCDALDAAPAPIVLFIDDFHLVTQPTAHALVQQILDSVHGRFLLILLSRTTPPLRIDHLILNDTVLTLSERDLAFDHDEFLALMPLLGMDSQPPTLLAELESRCTGWVTALKLLAHDLRHAPPTAAVNLAHLSAGSLQQFIQSRILSLLPDDLSEFAACAAFLPWMSAPLLAAATGDSEAACARVLARLVDASAFVTEFASPTSESHFRFHPLVQDALRRTTPDDPSARRRAAVWLCDHDLVDDALALLDDGRPTTDDGELPAVGHRPSAVDSVARATRRTLLRFDIVSAQRWLDALPAELLAAHAPLAVDAAWAAFLADSTPLFDVALSRAIAAVHRLPTGTDHDALRTEVAALEVYHHILHNRTDDARRLLADAEARPRVEDSFGNGYLHFMRSMLPLDPQNVEARMRSLQKSADIFERIGHEYGVVTTLYVQFLFKRRHLDFHGALTSSIFLEGFALQHNRTGHLHVRDCLMFRGELLYLQNRIPEARKMLTRVASVPAYDEQAADNIFFARAYLALCDAAESPEPSDALRSLDPLSDAVQWTQILKDAPHLQQCIVAWPRILRDFRAGHPERCRQTVESLRLTPADLSNQTHDLLRFAVLAGAVLGEYDAPQLAEQLDDFLHYMDAARGHYLALHVRILRTLHALMRGDESTALARLREALPIVERSGALRLLLDFPALQPLLHRCDEPFAHQVLALSLAKPQQPPVPDITRQHERILALVADGLSDKEIAVALTLTPRTVHSHLYRLFKKLGARNREEAVRIWKKRRGEVGDRR